MFRALAAAALPAIALACSGTPTPVETGGSGGTAAGGATSSGGATSTGGASSTRTDAGGGGSGGTGGECVPSGFPPQAEPYPVEIGGQQAWVHDEGFSSGYFNTYDELLVGPGGEPRKVHVFVPSEYAESCARYPVVYMNDGETSFWPGGPGNKSWEVAQGLADLYETGAIPPVIVVAIHALDRNVEYSHTEWAPDEPCCGVEEYADYVGDHVKPFIDASYRTSPEPENTAIVGSSRGGLAAFVLANLRPDRFRKAICMSSSFWLGIEPVFGGTFPEVPLADSVLLAMTKDTLSNPALRPRLWIDWGLVDTGGFHNEVIEVAAHEYGVTMVDLLKTTYGYTEGGDLHSLEDPIGEHDEVSWARRFPLAMKAIFGSPAP